LPPAVQENAVNSVRTYFGDLPPYQLAGFAHVWRGGDHYTFLILIYPDRPIAEAAATELHTRLSNAASLSSRTRAYYQMFTESASGEILRPLVYECADGVAALFAIRSTAGEADPPDIVARPYHLFMIMTTNRDMYFLGTEFVLPE
jgi:hypothetical protein